MTITDEQIVAFICFSQTRQDALKFFKPEFMKDWIQRFQPHLNANQPWVVSIMTAVQMTMQDRLPLGEMLPDLTYVPPEVEGEEGALVLTPVQFTEDYEAKFVEAADAGSIYMSLYVVPEGSDKSLRDAFNTASSYTREGEPIESLVVPYKPGSDGMHTAIVSLQMLDPENGLWNARLTPQMFVTGDPRKLLKDGEPRITII